MIGTIHINEIIENKDVLSQVKGEVKLTQKVVIPPVDTINISGLTNINKHTK